MKKLFFILLFSTTLFAQGVYEPLHSDVYEFLKRISYRGVIEFNEEILPISRMEIAEKLHYLDNHDNELSRLEKEELDYFIEEFGVELTKVSGNELNRRMAYFGEDIYGRYRAFSYQDEHFTANVSPILGGRIGDQDGESYRQTRSGLRFYGYIGDNIGYSFDYRDHSEKGKNIDITKHMTPEHGITVYRREPDYIEYSEVRTSISYSWDWGSFTAAKDYLEWGYGESGKLVRSSKAPSYTHIKLDVRPVEWLRFFYSYGWLTSDVVDSTELYPTTWGERNRTLYREKYIASHSLHLYPIDGLTFSLGESIIISDRFEAAYLMPIMFFRLSDHYLSRADNDAGSNSQFYAAISSKNHLKNTHLYGTVFIDEISIGEIFNPKKARNQLGFTIGASVTDLPIPNLTLTAEFTKIYPFVYKHYIPTQTYENASYTLGHWIEHNADQIYVSAKYRIIRGLEIKGWASAVREGEDGTAEMQYDLSLQQPPFLFGRQTEYIFTGLDIRYELYHELIAELQFRYKQKEGLISFDIWDEETKSDFYIHITYGL